MLNKIKSCISDRDPEDLENVTAFQGQLQQLFHLHDSGVDQSFIDALPVFLYKAIIGLKNPFDCAICLCEFEPDDKLRLLPKCSHAFHLECIDTWLLSHSTCPICRGSLIPDFSPNNNGSPIVLLLESGSDSSREIISDREGVVGIRGSGTPVGFHGEDEFGSSFTDISQKPSEIAVIEEAISAISTISEEKVVPVKLGKFRNVDVVVGGSEASSSNSNVDGRRCFSMGSFEYVLDDTSLLQVAIKPSVRKQRTHKPSLPLGYRQAMSECDCHSNREGFKDFEGIKSSDINGDGSRNTSASIGKSKRESFSVSKIWLRSKRDKPSTVDSSRQASSFRLPLHRTAAEDLKLKSNSSRRTSSEVDVSTWENHGSELGLDEEARSSNILESQVNPPSFARRTLIWLMGRQNKVVHSSSTPHI
ncbi:RING-H2 finger protein ATL13-like [Tasmannia lanceolata]|uniref:RING-H2 finger protein ATL13-like n=1 Tax=Tasmannia lanceolata TaxID=3420 RepID=UPI004063F2F5